jgi:hypothetical protein
MGIGPGVYRHSQFMKGDVKELMHSDGLDLIFACLIYAAPLKSRSCLGIGFGPAAI